MRGCGLCAPGGLSVPAAWHMGVRWTQNPNMTSDPAGSCDTFLSKKGMGEQGQGGWSTWFLCMTS